jgi:hypothetical protein
VQKIPTFEWKRGIDMEKFAVSDYGAIFKMALSDGPLAEQIRRLIYKSEIDEPPIMYEICRDFSWTKIECFDFLPKETVANSVEAGIYQLGLVFSDQIPPECNLWELERMEIPADSLVLELVLIANLGCRDNTWQRKALHQISGMLRSTACQLLSRAQNPTKRWGL